MSSGWATGDALGGAPTTPLGMLGHTAHAPEAAGVELRTIVGLRKAGAGPLGAPVESGPLLAGSMRGIWIGADGRLRVLTAGTGVQTVYTVDLEPPFERTKVVRRSYYSDEAPLVLAGATVFYDSRIYSGKRACTDDGPSLVFPKPMRVLMTIATADAGYLVGVLTEAADDGIGLWHLCAVRLRAADVEQWVWGAEPTSDWMRALDALVGPVVLVRRFNDIYERLQSIFRAAHQLEACFADAFSIGLHLANLAHSGARVEVLIDRRAEYWRVDELQGLPLHGVSSSLSRRGADSGGARTPAANVKHSNGLLMDRTGSIYFTEAGCLRRYSGYYAPLGTIDGATDLPPLTSREPLD